jgi:hypothetical protein
MLSSIYILKYIFHKMHNFLLTSFVQQPSLNIFIIINNRLQLVILQCLCEIVGLVDIWGNKLYEEDMNNFVLPICMKNNLREQVFVSMEKILKSFTNDSLDIPNQFFWYPNISQENDHAST